jgi:hypothetical protein
MPTGPPILQGQDWACFVPSGFQHLESTWPVAAYYVMLEGRWEGGRERGVSVPFRPLGEEQFV